MRKFLVVVLVLVVAVGAIGYWRGWFSLSQGGRVDVQVDRPNFDHDKKAFSKSVGEQTKALKEDFDNLWEKSKKLTGDEKIQTQKELSELKTKHVRLEQQLKELDDAGQDKFESIKHDISKNLEDVEKRIEELKKKLQKS